MNNNVEKEKKEMSEFYGDDEDYQCKDSVKVIKMSESKRDIESKEAIKKALATFSAKPKLVRKSKEDKVRWIYDLSYNDTVKLAKKMGVYEKCHSEANDPKHYVDFSHGDDFTYTEQCFTYYGIFRRCLTNEWNKT